MATPAWSNVRSGTNFNQLLTKEVALRTRDYHIVEKTDSRKLAEFLCQEGPLLLPLVERITDTEMALDELIDITGRAAIEAVLTLELIEDDRSSSISSVVSVASVAEHFSWRVWRFGRGISSLVSCLLRGSKGVICDP